MTRSIPFSPPNVGDEEIAAAVEVLKSGWITTGPRTAMFESAFAEYVQAPAALGLNSCTAGLHLALKTLGIGPGDMVATTTMTFAASVNVIEHVGATPLLVDVEPDTLNISPDSLRERLTPEVKAIIPVHYAGHPGGHGCPDRNRRRALDTPDRGCGPRAAGLLPRASGR